jgi:hypothetical protein
MKPHAAIDRGWFDTKVSRLTPATLRVPADDGDGAKRVAPVITLMITGAGIPNPTCET